VKPRANTVLRLRAGRVPHRQGKPSARWGIASTFAIPAFLLIYAVVAVRWSVPGWVGVAYLVASVVCFVVYAIDKSAAVRGGWRVSESTLILLGLAGGWPGAILAQQLLRHKSSKTSFRAVFWGSVLLNGGGFMALCSPLLSV
jgi:uncharacterized membrane protein YsdA (DUF1294 family)